MVRQLSGSAKRPTYEYSEVIRRRQRGLGHRPVHELQLLQKPVHACVPVSEAHRAPADGKGWPVREQKICLPWGGRLLLASTDEGGKERGGGGWGRDQHGPGKERPRLNGSVRNLVDDEQLLCLVCCPPRSYSYRSYAWLRRRLGRFKRLPTQEVGMTGSYWPGSHAHALEMLLSGWPLPLRKVRNFWVASAGEAMLHLDLSQGCFGESSPPMPLLIQVHSSAAMLAWLSLLREVKEQHNLSAVLTPRLLQQPEPTPAIMPPSSPPRDAPPPRPKSRLPSSSSLLKSLVVGGRRKRKATGGSVTSHVQPQASTGVGMPPPGLDSAALGAVSTTADDAVADDRLDTELQSSTLADTRGRSVSLVLDDPPPSPPASSADLSTLPACSMVSPACSSSTGSESLAI